MPPDDGVAHRLARKFAYQALLTEEFARAGTWVEFVNGVVVWPDGPAGIDDGRLAARVWARRRFLALPPATRVTTLVIAAPSRASSTPR